MDTNVVGKSDSLFSIVSSVAALLYNSAPQMSILF